MAACITILNKNSNSSNKARNTAEISTGSILKPSTSLPDIRLKLENGKVFASSLEVAEVFGKKHFNVLRDIEALEIPEDYHKLNFELMMREVETGKGARRSSPYYNMTRDGFTLLAMGFTGKQAMRFKLAYIEAFNRMEEELKKMAGSKSSFELPDFTHPALAAKAWADEHEARGKAEAELAITAPKAAVYDTVMAPESASIRSFCRSLPGVNLNEVSNSLCRCGILYKSRDGRHYAIRSAYKDSHFGERFSMEGKGAILITLPKGKQLLVKLYNENMLTMKKAFAKCNNHSILEERKDNDAAYSRAKQLPLL